jgi:hypothetical protein
MPKSEFIELLKIIYWAGLSGAESVRLTDTGRRYRLHINLRVK